MATKLYPPNIEGTIPAFATTNGTTTLVVPFSLNKAVSANLITGFQLKIKTISGTLLGTVAATNWNLSSSNMLALFDLSGFLSGSNKIGVYTDEGFSVGLYYKVQLAFISGTGEDQEIGYYSTVGVTKYTIAPSLRIENLTLGQMNMHLYEYTGVYSQKDGDVSEKMYSSRFRLYNYLRELIVDSGDILHNSLLDDTDNNEQYETYNIPQDLDLNLTYYLTFSATTTNNMTITTSFYSIIQTESVKSDIPLEKIDAELNFENGYINVKLIGEVDEKNNEKKATGAFILLRNDSKTPTLWTEITRFLLKNLKPSSFGWKDCTIEQGITYTYAIEQYNDTGLYSSKIKSKSICADFEDAFLTDGERQLKIRYNPKISTFKNDLLESKVDTIGSKYPFIFRNGYVKYKEFLISGLLSYFSDEEELFCSKEDLTAEEGFTYDIYSSENITAERLFKLKVLEWLTNGKPKIFRSPTEGNYIVRLLNSSLSPTDSTGRLIHTFNSTAYEICEFNFDNLKELSFIPSFDTSNTIQLIYQLNFDIETRDNKVIEKIISNDNELLFKGFYANWIKFENITPTLKVQITTITDSKKLEVETFLIGGGNASLFNFNNEATITSVKILEKEVIESDGSRVWKKLDNTSNSYDDIRGSFLYEYLTEISNVFDTYSSIEFKSIPIKQMYGSMINGHFKNIVECIEDLKTQFIKFYYLKFSKMESKCIYTDTIISNTNYKNLKYYLDKEYTIPFVLKTLMTEDKIYEVWNGDTLTKYCLYIVNGSINYILTSTNEWRLFSINGETFSLADKNPISGEIPKESLTLTISDATNCKDIEIGPGVKLEFGYQVCLIDYIFDTSVEKVAAQLQSYKDMIEIRWDEDFLDGKTSKDIERYNKIIEQAYNLYLLNLLEAIDEYKKVNLIE